jgi:4-hydroxyphenylpyruvate dioxygenase-like putative hemolysin
MASCSIYLASVDIVLVSEVKTLFAREQMRSASLIYTAPGSIAGGIVEVRFSISKIQHITFAVSDMKKTVNFYENVLGLKKTGEWDNYVVFEVEAWSLHSGSTRSFRCSSVLTMSTKLTKA